MLMDNDNYFKTEGDKYVFLLLYTDGKTRSNLLNITEKLYHDKEEAKRWKDNIEFKINLCCDMTEDKKRAIQKLNSLYHNMIDT